MPFALELKPSLKTDTSEEQKFREQERQRTNSQYLQGKMRWHSNPLCAIGGTCWGLWEEEVRADFTGTVTLATLWDFW